MRAGEFITEEAKLIKTNGLALKYAFNDNALLMKAFEQGTGNPLAFVKFVKEKKELYPENLWVNDEYRNKGIAKTMYDTLKSEGYIINRSHDQTKAGAGFWDKHRGEDQYVWEDDTVDEMALKQFTPLGDFEKPGPFRGVDKRLIPHPTNQLKAQKFFERTPYDFRLFFSNIPGTGRYSEYGPMRPEAIQEIFKDQAPQILQDSEDSITVVFVGNKGDSKVMMTPWIMAHRFGHAIQAGDRKNGGWSTWNEAEKHFFSTINNTLEQYYGKMYRGSNTYNTAVKWDLTPEYNALFNAIGTQRSSRTSQIKRPYEFLYELFAQYLKDGQITLNPLPTNLGYGRKAWGTPSKYLNIKPEYRDDSERQEASQMLANDMGYMFDDVLSSSVGKIFVM